MYCRAKKIHDSRLMTEVFCNNFLMLFESYGRQLHGASIQSGPPSALAIAVADTFRIPFGIATSAAFSPFYNFSSPYYGDEVWCSFDGSPLCGPVQGGVLWVDTHHAWMFKACQRIMDAVLSNARPLRFVVLVTDATRRCMDLLLCGHQKHPSVIAPLFHITDARVPTYNADAMTTKLCSHIHGFLLQSRCAFDTDPVDNHDVVRMLGQTLKLKYKTKLCHTPLHLQPSSKKVLSTIWKSAWEDECITRKRALDASPRDWGAIFESFDRINQLLPLCNAKWIRHILRFCNPRGCCARVSVFEPVIGCYMVFSMEAAEVYIGMVGQTAVRLFGVRWNSNGSASIGRPISDRGREHILAMLKCASGKSNAHAMYRYMSRIGAHRWGICPLVQDHNFRFLLADKNRGLLFVVCTVHWAQLFQAHILQNVKYQVLHAFGAVFLARNLLRITIIERMYSSGLIQTWRPILGARWKPPSKHSKAPSAKILIKSKSLEADGILKIRIVISHFSHPASKIGKLASRALSLLCRLVGDMDINFEIFSMYDAKGLFVSALSAADKDSVPWAGLELDMVDMYSEIPKDRVLDSVMYCVSVLRDNRKSRNPITWFAISTICKSLDRLGTGTSRDFMNLSIEMITSFVNFELWANADFTAGGYVLSQLIGLPMGGPISAQLAVLYLMSAEMRATRSALSVHKFIHGRYRDNFYIFGPKSVLFDLQQTMKVQLESTYAMPMTVEQFGTKVQVLEVIVDFDSQSRGLRLNSRALDVHTGAVSGVVRWPDRWSTNTTVWRSLVPGLCVKRGYWSWSHGDIYENVVLIVAELGYRDVPRRHWRTRVLNFCKENQIPVGPSDLMVMYEYGNFLRWG